MDGGGRKKRVRGGEADYELRYMHQGFHGNGKSKDEYIEQFRNKLPIRVDRAFRAFRARSGNDAGEVGRLVGLLAFIGIWEEAVARCWKDWKACGGQGQNLYTRTREIMLKVGMERQIGNVRVFP